MAKEQEKLHPIMDDETVERMKSLNSNPQMRVREFTDADGKLTQKEVEVSPRTSSSVEFATDSKGNVKPQVKVYHETAETAFETAVILLEKAMAVAAKYKTS